MSSLLAYPHMSMRVLDQLQQEHPLMAERVRAEYRRRRQASQERKRQIAAANAAATRAAEEARAGGGGQGTAAAGRVRGGGRSGRGDFVGRWAAAGRSIEVLLQGRDPADHRVAQGRYCGGPHLRAARLHSDGA